MFDLSNGQLLLYGGVGLIVVAAAAAIICIIIFIMTGKKIRRELENDYGRLEH